MVDLPALDLFFPLVAPSVWRSGTVACPSGVLFCRPDVLFCAAGVVGCSTGVVVLPPDDLACLEFVPTIASNASLLRALNLQ